MKANTVQEQIVELKAEYRRACNFASQCRERGERWGEAKWENESQRLSAQIAYLQSQANKGA